MFDEKRFSAQIVMAGVTIKDLADYLGVSPVTVYRKIKADGNFTRDEINKMIVFLKIDEPEQIFFATQLT